MSYRIAHSVCLVLLTFFKGGVVNCSLKTWKYNVNVENRNNWIGEAYSEGCRGLIFPIFPTFLDDACMMAIKNIVTDELVLPKDGDVLIQEGGFISFSDSADTCIRLKQVKYMKWNDPENWMGEEDNNKAIPHVEKLPCVYDDVVFPRGSAFAVVCSGVATSVNSVEIYGVPVSDDQWRNVLYPKAECNQFVGESYDRPGGSVTIVPNKCTENTGCVCHENAAVWDDVCVTVRKNRQLKTDCSAAVQVIGHCREFCGGVLHVVPNENFNLREFRAKLSHYDNVDIYASKVSKGVESVIQVVLAEKERFNGDSIVASEALYSQLRGEPRAWKIKSVVMSVSGFPLDTGVALRYAISFIFGTFVAVVAVFALIFLAYTGSARKYLQATSNRLYPSVRFAFARFENKGDGNLSLAGSVLSLEKEFDNPMYGRQSVPSTSTSTITEVLTSDECTKTTYENPMYFTEVEQEDLQE